MYSPGYFSSTGYPGTSGDIAQAIRARLFNCLLVVAFITSQLFIDKIPIILNAFSAESRNLCYFTTFVTAGNSNHVTISP